MRKSIHGFTIVELLIVIVVIAILAAISIVAYTGIQQRARDNARTQAVADIRKALELYKVDHDRYPPHIGSGTNVPSGFTGLFGTSYSHSVDTAGNWLKNLTDSGVIDKAPIDPINNNTYYFTYWSSGANGYGICPEPFYVLAVFYENAANVPSDSRALDCTGNNQTGNWTTSSTRAVFSNIRTPGT